ncbi:MAG TPA: DEAD/DEAH box helicase [Gammaproteobacteria bacterium]|nr:DEAD/DEAH box helicase [Gammaproteobacteria bacterium]
MLADEMGLGKTVQAIATCEMLHQLHGIQRVLVISLASLRAEWEEQIKKFTHPDSLIIQGPHAAPVSRHGKTAAGSNNTATQQSCVAMSLNLAYFD